MAKAMFGAGCFWGVEASFRRIKGVSDAICGYSGGHLENPTYKQVCAGNTEHAEVVEVTFDPQQVSYEELLNNFWRCHDPTQVDRQGADYGRQYRSVIFTYDDEQQAQAEQSRGALDASGVLAAPIATTIAPAQKFWRAEDYHQRYLER